MIEDYKTYQEWIDNGGDISDVTDKATSEALTEYFFGYYLGWKDGKIFERYYRRNLGIFYPMYKEQLRLQPGGLSLDWFVETYGEKQIKHTGETSGTSNNTITVNGTKTSDVTHTTEQNVDTYNLTDTDNPVVDSDVHSGGHSDIISGGHTEKHKEGLHTTESNPHVEKVRTNGGHISDWNGHSEISAQLPMSESYSKFIGEGDEVPGIEEEGGAYQRAYQHMPALEWTNASSQGQSGDRKYTVDRSTVTESYKYDKNGTGDITKTHGDSSDPDSTEVTYDNEGHTFTYDNETTTKNLGKRVHEKTGTVSHTNTSKDEGNDTNSSTTNNEGTTAGTDKSTDREIHTGRNKTPAEIIQEAVRVIQHTNAFMWFVGQLEPCFLTDMEE